MQENKLKEIIKYKIKWLKTHKNKKPLEEIKKKIKISDRNFYDKLKIKAPFFILEIKKSSPSLGIINKNFNIFKIAEYYKKKATIVSILTDEKYFNGNFKFLKKIHKIIKQPILCKDFFINPYQVYLARYYKADAILLMLSVLNNNDYITLSSIAHNLNMGVLTEINNIEELNRAIELKAKVIGINNRNLNNMSININRTYNIAPLIPKNKIIISESGIKNHFQIRKLKKVVHGFLIGTSIMKSKNLNTKINSFIFGNNKICGLTRVEDAKEAEKAGAVYGGLIFITESIRNITLNKAKDIISETKLHYVGVFKNERIKKIISIVKSLNLFAIQLHGSEDQKYIINLKKKLPKKIQIWKALNALKDNHSLNMKHVDYYLFDNPKGGSGICFDWKRLKKYNLKNVFLSGGLSVKNCCDAIKLNCFGLDFNSKIEKSPGIKDHKKIKLLFKKLKYH